MDVDEQPDPEQVHANALIIDGHADTPQRFVDDSWNFTDLIGAGHLNLDSARRGNLAAEFFAIWPEPVAWKGHFADRALALIDGMLEQVRRRPNELALCLSPADIVAAKSAGKFAVLMGIEGGHAIENSLGLLRTFHTLGVRYMTLTWANSNEWADSSGDNDDDTVPHHNGLTPFGHEVIAEMNRLGMMIDVSHASDKTFADVIAATHAPILASHSAARALTNSPRNLTDDQLRALAANGGVCMVNFYSAFIDENYRQAVQSIRAERTFAHDTLAAEYAARREPLPFHLSNQIDRDFAAHLTRPPLKSLINHFDHIIRVAGSDHVGIGSDFDGISALPEGIDSAADLPKITTALLDRGHSAADLHKVLGGNLMRVFTEVQRALPPPPSLSARSSKQGL